MKTVRRMFDEAIFVGHLGITLERVGPGYCETSLACPAPTLYQQSGALHAGVMTTMADHTAGGAIVSELEEGLGVVSIDLSVQFLRAARGPLRCRAESLRCGRRTAVAEAVVYRGAGEEGVVGGEEGASPLAKATVTLAVVPWTPGKAC